MVQSLRERAQKLEELTEERVKDVSGSGRRAGSSPWVARFSRRLRAGGDRLQGLPTRTVERLAISTVLLVAALFTGFNMFLSLIHI